MAPLHIVMSGSDTSMFSDAGASDTPRRLLAYAAELERRRPGSQLTYVSTGAPKHASPIVFDNLVSVPAPGGRLTSLWRLHRRLRQLHRARRIDVLTTQTPGADGLAALLLARGRSIPVVAQVHGDLFADAALAPDRRRRVVRRLQQVVTLRLLSRYSALRVVGEEVAARLRALDAPPTHVIPVPSLAAVPSDGPPRTASVLFVGRLSPEKRVDRWLEVAAAVADQVPATFDIVGDGPHRQALERRAAELGLDRRCRFHGAVANDALGGFYGAASVLLLTSDHEGFGRVLVEAARAGTPAVSTDIPGPRDIIQHEVTGFLCPSDDLESLAASVVRLLSDPELAASMGNAARAAANAAFDPRVLTERWIDLLVRTAEQP